ncbi:MAG: cyclic nucleotide-binding/CBS domain-containing protein [Planctomycetota bacterium]
MSTRVEQVMSPLVVTARASQPVSQIREQMLQHGIHCLPVVADDGSLEGIVTVSDVLGADTDATPVSDVLTRAVFTVHPNEDAFGAAELMLNNRVHHVVVWADDSVQGVVSSYDLLPLIPRTA